MEFDVHVAGVAADLGAVAEALARRDPAALVDIDPVAPVLRISAALDESELLEALHETGCEVSPLALRRRPSVCCGGCGG